MSRTLIVVSRILIAVLRILIVRLVEELARRVTDFDCRVADSSSSCGGINCSMQKINRVKTWSYTTVYQIPLPLT